MTASPCRERGTGIPLRTIDVRHLQRGLLGLRKGISNGEPWSFYITRQGKATSDWMMRAAETVLSAAERARVEAHPRVTSPLVVVGPTAPLHAHARPAARFAGAGT